MPHPGCCPLNRQLLWEESTNPSSSQFSDGLNWGGHMSWLVQHSPHLHLYSWYHGWHPFCSQVFGLCNSVYGGSLQNHAEPKHEISRLEKTCRRASTSIHPHHLCSSAGYCPSEGQSIKLLGYGANSTNNMQPISPRCK